MNNAKRGETIVITIIKRVIHNAVLAATMPGRAA